MRADGLAATATRLDVADRRDIRRVVALLKDLDGLVNRGRQQLHHDEDLAVPAMIDPA
jgi:hypothetical protein